MDVEIHSVYTQSPVFFQNVAKVHSYVKKSEYILFSFPLTTIIKSYTAFLLCLYLAYFLAQILLCHLNEKSTIKDT